jgi:TatD DNase family protein
LSRFGEIVFCGFGEPTYRMDLIDKLCDYFHEKGLKTRLNTNGQGSLINKRDIIPELKGKVDKINVSLNASCAENYQKICRSQFGENGFGAMVEFAKNCKRAGLDCRFSIVDCIGEAEIESCKMLAQKAGVPLLIRKYIADC